MSSATLERGTRRFPDLAAVQEAASLIRRTVPEHDPCLPTREGPRTHLTIGPGVWKLWDRDWARYERTLERQRRAREVDVNLRVALGEPRFNDGMTTGRRITGWSDKSRNRMKIRFSASDWTTLFDGERQAAMVTLTMPDDWVKLAPTAAAFKEAVRRWQMAWKYAWGEMPRGGWKMEFQRRGAPHLHIITAIPEGAPKTRTRSMARCDAEGCALPHDDDRHHVGVDFRSWLSVSWPKACRTRELVGDVEAVKHERAGTGVDIEATLRYGDPLRMAQYFEKHGVFEAKAYQNDMPDEWLVEGVGGAQFWGVWGVPTATATVEVDAVVADKIARVARRKMQAEGVTTERHVWRGRKLGQAMRERLAEVLEGLHLSDSGYVTPAMLLGPITDIMSACPRTAPRFLSKSQRRASSAVGQRPTASTARPA